MKTCTKCGITQPSENFSCRGIARDGKCSWCKECYRAYHAAHAETVNAQRRAWRAANLAEAREKQRAYQAAHVQAIKARGETYKAAHRKEHNAQQKVWVKSHPEAMRTSWKRHRARKRGASLSNLTAGEWAALKEAYDFRCAYCGRKVKVLTQDHILALSKGGDHTLINIVPTCQSCNTRKGIRPAPNFQMRLLFSKSGGKKL